VTPGVPATSPDVAKLAELNGLNGSNTSFITSPTNGSVRAIAADAA
jgi:hypothetical protein